jgi:hypothetical protein
MTVPNAVYNGFTAATTDSGNVSFMHDWALDGATNTLDWERIENWRARGTHWMTVLAKDVAEILHQRRIRVSYFHGASRGGWQAMVEAQEYPADYDGIRASCPAINWTKALLAGLWPIAVMNSSGHVLSPAKLEAFRLAVHESVGGSETYFRLRERVVNRVMDELVLEPVLNDTRGRNMQLSSADDAVSYNLKLRGGIGYRDSILFLRPPKAFR